MDDAVGGLIDQMARFDTFESLHGAFEGFTTALGFEHFSYLGVCIPNSDVTEPFVLSNYPDEWISHYVRRAYLSFDPVVHTAMQRTLPYDWTEFSRERQYRRFFGEAAEFGMGNHGFSVPVRGPDGEMGLITVSTSAKDCDWKKLIAARRHLLHVAAGYFHASLVTNVVRKRAANAQAAPEPNLTARERECLHWVAQGKTAWETAEILGITERTVVFHTNNAKAKLGVSGKNHAVVKSIALGLLSG